MAKTTDITLPTQQAKSDILAFTANHYSELAAIKLLSPSEQETAYSSFVNNEIERIVKLQPENQEVDFRTLVAWETDRVVGIKEPEIQKAAAIKYGFNNTPIAEYYKDLYTKDAELKRQDADARGKISAVGWGSFTAALAGMSFLATRKDVEKRISPNNLVQITAIALVSAAAGLLGRAVGVELFARNNRNESKILALESRNAFEKELAITIENRMREMATQKTAELSVSDKEMDMQPSGNAAGKIPQRSQSHITQAMLDKIAGQESASQLA